MEVVIIGAPVDLGADRRGVDMGASAIRYAGLEEQLRDMGHVVRDRGNVAVMVAESGRAGDGSLKYLEPIVDMAVQLASMVSEAANEGCFPLVLGGDHSVSLGSVAGVTERRSTGIIWMDAHADFNVAETSPSGNIHGMVLSAITGQGDERLVNLGGRSQKVKPQDVALIGVRDIDPGERTLLLSSGIHVFTMHDVDRMGLPSVVELAMDRLSARVDSVHLSLDLDVVDPLQAPGVGTPVSGGLSFRETHLAMELLAQTGRIRSMDVVEVNPILDNHNETAKLAMEFTASALGKRIL